MKLIDTSITYDDGTKTEIYTDTGNIKTANFKVVPYNFDQKTGIEEKYYLVYKRCKDNCFGDYLNGIRNKHKTLEQCEMEIENLTK
jgi:hypothetical protein